MDDTSAQSCSPVRIPPYPDLPVVAKRAEFLDLLTKHQVIIVQADTGSGKSTQLPKFMLEAGLRAHGRIGVTQPRRIAALSIADRLREELQDESLVAARIRFLEEGVANAPLKVMTDGILLQEYRKDRLLRQYGAILLDEAHERSLNIDILLGILRGVVERRPEFRLVVASATLDAKLFQEFFPGSVILEAEGRLYPVDIEYRPAEEGKKGGKARGDSGLLDEAQQAILDLLDDRPDHLLCFLPTERDIQDLADDLRGILDEKRFILLPLFGRLSPADQRRVFRDMGKTKVVLATNIAETSLTIPGIAYVVDTGQARVARYNPQSRIQGLPVEDISQASARQRAGRAGRVKPGRCIRLYSEAELLDRPDYTDPEIRRTNLANVVLQLRSLGLALDSFPFLQAPPRTAFRSAYRQLHELGALIQPEADAVVTRLGHEMAKLPMDVALSAVLLRARELGVLQPALIVTAALSIQDPRINPMDGKERDQARACHRRHGGNKSDFLTLLRLWNFVHKGWEKGSSLNKLRKLCEDNWLHFLRMREWMDLYEQFARILKVEFLERVCDLETFHRDSLHIALLGGFLGGLAHRDTENSCYRLVGGREGHLFPGSDLYGKSPEWVFAAEVRETSRVFLSRCAEIRSEWVLQVAKEFCTRRWYDPQWNPERGFVEAVEEIQFRGMVISRGQRVDFARVDPDACAQIFWREAVVEANLPRPFTFMANNARVLERLRATEARLRKWGLAPSESMLVDYFRHVAPEVNSLPTLKKWIAAQGESQLAFTVNTWVSDDDLRNAPSQPITLKHATHNLRDALQKARSRPEPRAQNSAGGALESFDLEGVRVTGELLFDRNHARDGLRLEIPIFLMARLTPARLARQISQWRVWMLDALFGQIPTLSRRKLEPQREVLEDLWVEALGADPEAAPWLVLVEQFRTLPDTSELSIQPQQDTHLRLHLDILDAATQRKVFLDLAPEWGPAQVFLFLQPQFYVAASGICTKPFCRAVWTLPHGVAFAFGIQREDGILGYGMQEPEEAYWWAARLETFPAEPWSGPLRELLEDRLQVLEVLGAKAVADWIPLERHWLLGILLASSRNMDVKTLSSRLERFSGLEGLQGRKMASFAALGKGSNDQNERARQALIRSCTDAASLGIEAFIRAWNQLRDCSLRLRRNQKLAPSWFLLADLQDTVNTLPERLALTSAWLGGIPSTPWESLQSLSNFRSWRDARDAWYTDHVHRWKNLRSTLRPWLSGQQTARQEQRNQLRSMLSKLESNRQLCFEGLYIEITLDSLATELRVQASRKTAVQDDPGDAVTKDQLEKLRDRFRGK
ncbi:MAG TPA: ATP-dependent RNA helicase HrpA [Fibrobacteraceae bacterium]|nr:ATP-dependent RNA helicase HrpA [Fibrobacteraceae bacterium]